MIYKLVLAFAATGASAWQLPARLNVPTSGASRCPQPLAIDDEEAYRRGWKRRPEGEQAPAPTPDTTDADPETGVKYRTLGRTEVALRGGTKKKINTELDRNSASDTFEALCKSCGVTPDRDAAMDFDGFKLAFEQLFNGNNQVDPEVEDELRGMMSTKVRNDDGSISLDDDVTMAAWNKFHKRWREHSTMAAMVELEVEKKAEAERNEQREKNFAEALAKAQTEAKEQARPKLMSEVGAKGDGLGAAELAAQHVRSRTPSCSL